jgi:hypothetical protein
VIFLRLLIVRQSKVVYYGIGGNAIEGFSSNTAVKG